MPKPLPLFTRWLPLLIWMALIFTGSSDLLAGEHTSRYFVPLMHFLFGNRLSAEQIEYAHHLFRKGGHLTEYAVLCVLFWRVVASLHATYIPLSFAQKRNGYLIAVACSLVYAATDEFHQSFVPSRTASVYDVMIDTVGAALGLALYLLLARSLARKAGRV